MRNRMILGLAVAVFCTTAIAGTPKEEDFPLKFRVGMSYVVGSDCIMMLHKVPSNGWVYEVKDRGVFQCSVWRRNTVLSVRSRKSGFAWGRLFDILDKDDKGRPKVFTYEVKNTFSE
jgi:hypothetical protein